MVKTLARLLVGALTAIAMLVMTHGIAQADPYDSPGSNDPGYRTGQTQPGVEQYPAICQAQPLACALHYDPGSGSWLRPKTN